MPIHVSAGAKVVLFLQMRKGFPGIKSARIALKSRESIIFAIAPPKRAENTAGL